MRPSVSVTTRPQAACANNASASGKWRSVLCIALSWGRPQESADGLRSRARRAYLRAVSIILDDAKRAVTHRAMHVLADRARRDDVFACLQNERRRDVQRQHTAMIREKRDTCKLGGDPRIGPAKAVN